jgi:hypothetical protein
VTEADTLDELLGEQPKDIPEYNRDAMECKAEKLGLPRDSVDGFFAEAGQQFQPSVLPVTVRLTDPTPQRTQGDSLVQRRAEMEDALQKLGLPRDSWHGFCVAGYHETEPDSIDDVTIVIAPSSAAYGEHPDLWREHVRHTHNLSDEDRSTAVWTAGVAWAADQALRTRDPERRFLFGRMLEAFDVNRCYPKIGARALNEVRAAGGRAAAAKRHDEHVKENILPYQKEYRDLLAIEKRRLPRESPVKLSAKIIRTLAERDGAREKRLRDMIKPREQMKHVP